MRNLCADDVRKDKLVVDGTLDLLIAATGKGMRFKKLYFHLFIVVCIFRLMTVLEEFASDAGCMEHALACLAAISLRSPGNAQRIVDTGCRLQSYLLHRSARFRKHLMFISYFVCSIYMAVFDSSLLRPLYLVRYR